MVNKYIIPLAITLVSFSIKAEEVSVTIAIPTSTYGIGAFNKQVDTVDICTVFVNGVPKDNTKISTEGNNVSDIRFKLTPGLYDFHTECHGPVDEDNNRQKYFQSEAVQKSIAPGSETNVSMKPLVVNPKRVKVKVESPHVNAGDWKIQLLNGEIRSITLDDNKEFFYNFHDENPVYKFLTLNEVEIGQVVFDKYTLTLMPKKTVSINDAEQDIGISVDINDGGAIFNPEVGLVINDPMNSSSTIELKVYDVPLGNYYLYVKSSSGYVHITGTLVDNYNSSLFNGTNNFINQANGNITIQLNGDFYQEGNTYKIFLIPQSSDL